MDLRSFQELFTSLGTQALLAAQNLNPREEDFLSDFTKLSRQYPADLARAALEAVILRTEAQVKFTHADRMFFTRSALEQASGEMISHYRAQRFQGFDRLIDLGCSIGGDTIALAKVAPTIGVDRDELRLHMAQANLIALGLDENCQLVLADLQEALPFRCRGKIGVFFDPARRDERGERIHTVDAYQPPLSIIQDWLNDYPALGVKLSPGVDLDELSRYEAEVEFISVQGELKEAVLWFGDLKQAHRRATLLPGQHTLSIDQPEILEARLSVPKSILYEPDPAILRAGLVRQLAVQLDACQLDPEIAYLTSDHYQTTPFARAWEVEAWFPFNLKRLRAELRERNVGEVVVKKRGSPLQPEALIHELRLKGSESCVVFLTQLQGKPIVILTQRT
jgi:hypothetical protein